MVAWVREKCPPSPLLPVAGEIVGPWITRVGELAQSLISYGTLGADPTTHPGHHTRTNLAVRRTRESVLGV